MFTRRLSGMKTSAGKTAEGAGPSKTKYENTYKIDPDKEKKFAPHKIEPVVEKVFRTYLDDQAYNHRMASTLVRELATIIKDRIKDLEFPRYKIVCNVMIGQMKNQGIETASRCIWDDKQDNHACVYYQNETLFAVAMVHGIYFE
jgi:hypothetical protein